MLHKKTKTRNKLIQQKPTMAKKSVINLVNKKHILTANSATIVSDSKTSEKRIWQKPQKRKLDTTITASANNVPQEKTSKVSQSVKPPTLAEINELKETRNLYHSNLFRLQSQEMLKEVQIKEKYINFVQNWLLKFNQFLRNLKSYSEKAEVHRFQWLKKNSLQMPLNLKELGVQNQKPLQFNFEKPTCDAVLIGAASTQTLLGPNLLIDVAVSMPSICFQKDDYLNLMYEQKRTLYLTYLTAQLFKSKFEGLTANQLNFSCYANNPLKILLEIIPTNTKGKISSKLTIRLFVTCDEGTFKLSRFVPWNSNIRTSIFGDSDDNDDKDVLPFATPTYNANVLFDLTMKSNQNMLNNMFHEHKNFQDGLVLLKVWLKQRELHKGLSGFSMHLLAMYIAHLYKQRKLNINMSCYQVARTFWHQLAQSCWDENGKGISLCDNNADIPNRPTLEQFHTYYDTVFIDATGFFNICANLSVELYRRVRQEAKLAVDMLNDVNVDSFQILFMKNTPLYTQMDHILKINNKDAVEQLIELHLSPADKCNYIYNVNPLITNLLRKGLDDRVNALIPIEEESPTWSCTEKNKVCSIPNVLIGIVLNVERAFDVLDKGPESIAENAEDFRKFWGDKAELRRFQDGSITESVVWAAATDSPVKKRCIVRTIVLHLLQHHFQLSNDDVIYIASDLDVAYKLTSAFKINNLPEKYKIKQNADAEQLSLQVIHTFDDLVRKLHGLSELPLEIVSIAGISPVFRYCEPTPLLPLARCINNQFYTNHVLHCVMQLGLSGKWPNELAALRSLKIAFYIQIAKLLREKHRLLVKVSYEGIWVLMRGYCFVIEIAHQKEITLIKKQVTEHGITQYVDCATSILLEKRQYILPKVNGALHALYQQQPAFGGAVMIAKRWLYSQLIDDGLWPDECTELLISSLFLKTNTQQICSSPQTYFLRFLQLIVNTDWRTELLLINFNNEMDENEIYELEQRFSMKRDEFPTVCIITAYDQKHYGNIWTSTERPNVNVLARVTILARETLNALKTELVSKSSKTLTKLTKIFKTTNQGYDLVIQLKSDMVTNSLAYEFGSPFVPWDKPNWKLPLAGTNFMRSAVSKLREAYGDFAAFFYNPCGGKEIALIWKPEAFELKDFKVNDVNGCALSNENSAQVQCKREIFVEDFKIILKDFYLRIETVESLQSDFNNKQKTIEIKKAKQPLNELIKKQSNKTKENATLKLEEYINNKRIKKMIAPKKKNLKKKKKHLKK